MATMTVGMADSKIMIEISLLIFLNGKSRYLIKVIVIVFIAALSGQHVKLQIHFVLKYVIFTPGQEMGK